MSSQASLQIRLSRRNSDRHVLTLLGSHCTAARRLCGFPFTTGGDVISHEFPEHLSGGRVLAVAGFKKILAQHPINANTKPYVLSGHGGVYPMDTPTAKAFRN
jgi:hypothetical protein